MTIRLIQLLSNFMELMEDWKLTVIPNEEDFIDQLKKITIEISEEIKKQQLPVIKNE